MNNKAKILIAVGILGLVLIGSGVVMGSGTSAIPAMFSDITYPEGSQQVTEVKKADIRALELNLFQSNLKIRIGESFELTGTGFTDSYVSNGTFYAGATEATHAATLFGMRVEVPSKWVCGYGSYVLTIPEKHSLEQITIHTNRCNITGDNLIAANVTVKMKSGNMDINTISADTLELSTTRGKINVQNTKINSSATVTATKNIQLNNFVDVDNPLNNLTLTTSRGDITVTGRPTGSSTYTTKRGNITPVFFGSEQNYSLQANQGTLNVTPSTVKNAGTDHYGDVSFDCKRGSANVSFQGKAEKEKSKEK